MASIQIKDLDDSREMDREAMRAVAGGCAGTTFSSAISPYRSPLTQTEYAHSPFSWASIVPGDHPS